MATGPRYRHQGRHGLPTAHADEPGGWPGGDDLRDSAAGVGVLDADLRYRFANPAFCRITGESEAGLVGRRPSPAAEQYLGTPTGLPDEVLADGVPRTRVTGPGGRCHTTCLRLENEGMVTGLMCVVAESSAPRLEEELARADARLAAADEAVERIGTSLDEGGTCRELAEFLGSWISEAASVALLPPPLKRGAPPPRRPSAAMMCRVAGSGAVDLLTDGERLRPRAESAAARAVESGLPAAEYDAAGHSAVLAVPLTRPPDGGGPGGQVMGVALLARTGAAFTGHDITVARHAARRAAVGVAHAREFATEQRRSVELQRALLAEPGKPHPNLRFATRYLPAGSSNIVGGDWCETVRLHYGRTLLVMGDVMGHGVEAAVEMNTYRSMLRDVAAADLPPHRVLRQLDIAISETMARPATCLLARVDPARGLGSFSSAGHLPPVVFAADGHAELVDVPAGPPLGTGVGGYELVTRSLTPDDTLLLYTDGLVERRGEDIDDSLRRLIRVRMPCTASVDEMVEAVVRELDAEHAEDDVALLAARIRSRRPHSADQRPFQDGRR
ncbi:serine/threonine-protein phosphatase [Streptomyces sp. ICN441]|uniref:PP2C family protein-serine/threonine phosphatase n=1 Tax=Streptomyces sp. ICN441 TaxID=2558286 RepID=UPI001069EAFB|nr:PP2C family protein-serine/threonine phosphatase [Streptomyces sp. ICN441]TFE58175.1 serine/threonine-protein phosphatase [Streptomyces sp. ICN441]